MKYRFAHTLVTTSILLGQLFLSGCSLISAGVTATSNAISARKTSVSLQELASVDPGTPLVVELDNESELRGTYAGYIGDQRLLLLKVSDQEVQVPLSDVIHIRKVYKKYSIWGAFLTGAAIDIIILYAITQTSIPIGIGGG